MTNQFKFAAFSIGAVITSCLLLAGDPPNTGGSSDDGAEALRQLQIGNARFLCGKSDHPHCDADRRGETFKGGQHPFAVFLTCSDSRVPVEVVFDQGVGDIFVIRVAGNVTDKHQTGSIEYALEHLHSPLVVVMGHRACGAVSAAASNGHIEGNVASIVESIKPAVERTERANPGLKGDGLIAEAIKANVYLSIENLLTTSPSISQLVKSKKVTVVGAVYDIETGTVNWLGRHPDESKLCSGEAVASDDRAQPGTGKDADEKPKTAVAGATATKGANGSGGNDGHGGGSAPAAGGQGSTKPKETAKPKQPATGGHSPH